LMTVSMPRDCLVTFLVTVFVTVLVNVLVTFLVTVWAGAAVSGDVPARDGRLAALACETLDP